MKIVIDTVTVLVYTFDTVEEVSEKLGASGIGIFDTTLFSSLPTSILEYLLHEF